MGNKDFCVTILRFATLFGYTPRMRFDLVINVMVKRALLGQNLIVNGDGIQYRPFLHVKDAARAIITVIESDPVFINKNIFNVGNEELNFTIKDLAIEIQKHFPNINIEKAPSNNDVRSYKVKFKKFEHICQFKPEVNLLEGVTEIEEAYKTAQLVDMEDINYYNLQVMKKLVREQTMTYSLALSPRWASKDPLIQSK